MFNCIWLAIKDDLLLINMASLKQPNTIPIGSTNLKNIYSDNKPPDNIHYIDIPYDINVPKPIINDEEWTPRVLVIGPGGPKGLNALGFLSPLEDSGIFNCCDTYCGVSVGAIISLLIVAGYQMREIVAEAATLDIFKDIDGFTFQSIIENKGLISNEPVRKRLTQLIINKFGKIPSLYNLYLQTGKAYVAVTYNATDKICEIMGPFTHPDESCIDITMFSMNIPFVFYQLIYKGKTYVDGALGNPYPIDYFDDGNTNILGIYMTTSDPKIPQVMSHRPGTIADRIDNKTSGELSIGTYSARIVHSLMNQIRNGIIQRSSNRCKHICLETKSVNAVGYNLSTEDKARMLVEGFNEGKQFLARLKNNTYVGPNIPPKSTYTYPPYYMIDEINTPNILSAMNNL